MRDYFAVEQAYPFDWWVSPFNATLQVLESRFTGLFQAPHLAVSPDRETVVDTSLNIMHHHDFIRDESGKIEADLIEQQLNKLRAKYDYLAQRFLTDLAGKKVLFIRNRCGNDPVYLKGDYGDLQPEQCLELHQQLRRLLPATNFDILATNKPGFERFSHNGSDIFSDSIVEYGDCDDYRVSPRGWAELFRRNRIALRTAK
ncbi:hypothetical protein L0937_15555 [Paracidovorax citrulli]